MTHAKSLAPRLTASALVLTLCALLASCAASPAAPEQSDYADLTLVDTKSSAQLLRNETASRVPAEAVNEVRKTVDESNSCLAPAEDPDGLLRFWTSSARLELVVFPTKSVHDIVDDVAATFAAEGWLVTNDNSRTAVSTGDAEDAALYSAVLTRDDSPAAITVAAVEPENSPTWISIDVHGPCVATLGAESDEVTSLEGTS